MPNITQRGFSQIAAMVVLAVGIIVGVYLVGSQLNFIPKAGQTSNARFVDSKGNTITKTTSPTVLVQLSPSNTMSATNVILSSDPAFPRTSNVVNQNDVAITVIRPFTTKAFPYTFLTKSTNAKLVSDTTPGKKLLYIQFLTGTQNNYQKEWAKPYPLTIELVSNVVSCYTKDGKPCPSPVPCKITAGGGSNYQQYPCSSNVPCPQAGGVISNASPSDLNTYSPKPNPCVVIIPCSTYIFVSPVPKSSSQPLGSPPFAIGTSSTQIVPCATDFPLPSVSPSLSP